MPPYSGIHFQVLLLAHEPGASVEPTTVSARDWETSATLHLPSYPFHKLLGRIRNLDVELFASYPSLHAQLEELDYTVRAYDRNKCMSIYPDTEFKDRNLVQKLQDQLYDVLRVDGEEIGYGIIAATKKEWVLVCKLDREMFNPENPCPPVLTAHGVAYDTIGYILDNDVFILAPEKDVKRFYLAKPPWVIYKILDKTLQNDIRRFQANEKAERVRQYKRDKRKAKKLAAKAATAGIEQGRIGVLMAEKDSRVGGNPYKKNEHDEEGAVVVEGKKGGGKEREIVREESMVKENPRTAVKDRDRPATKEHEESAVKKGERLLIKDNKKPAVKENENPVIKEIKKLGWFFSGEDVLKGERLSL